MKIHVLRNEEETVNHLQSKRPVDHIFKTIRPSMIFFHRSPARSEDVEALRSWWPKHRSAVRSAASDDRFSFTAEERWAHYRRSLRATLITFAAVVTLFALFFGLVAACGGL
jgi:hypothetical protein